MAENTDTGDEGLEKSQNIEPEKKPEANIPLVDPESIIPTHETENMETHAHHLHKAPSHGWKHYMFEFLMLFLAVFAGFLAENQREHMVEKKRAHQFLQSMLLDVRKNTESLDSLMQLDRLYIVNYDSLIQWLLTDSLSIDRGAFANKMGAVWMRNFLVRRESYEQMKFSGSLRYAGDIEFLKSMMDYDRITKFAEYRNQEFEKKYYQELFIPALYKSYDLTCQINLDTSNLSKPAFMEKISHHHDVLTGNDAVNFRHDMGTALMLRLERLRRSLDAFINARVACVKMENLINKQLQ